ncbi:MAG: hypothetical protein IH598_07600 [Bacteroidales bacterium]|nr:hypothetical protein [Bacteroidales bacterium]
MLKKVEVVANIILAFIGLVAGIVFFIYEMKELSVVFFAIAIGSILYQFLGGIGEQNTVTFGFIKFGGAAAILLGFMYFLKEVVLDPVPKDLSLSINPEQGWVPIDTETGKIKKITISNGSTKAVFPDSVNEMLAQERKNHEYQLSRISPSKFSLELKSKPTDTVGFIDLNNFTETGLFNKVKIAEDSRAIQIFTLYPDDPTKNSSKKIETIALPFEIKVFGTSRFSIEPFIENQEVVIKTSWIIPYGTNNVYAVFLEQANSTDSIKFSKWLVEKLALKLEK